MKKFLGFLMIAALVLAFCAPAEAQWVNGKWIRPHSVNDDVFASAAISGKKLVENEFAWWFPVDADSGTVSKTLSGSGGWVLDGSAPPTVTSGGVGMKFGFDADGGSTGDDVVYLTFPIPANYAVDSLSIKLFFYHLDDNGGATDAIVWDGTFQAVGSNEDLFAAGTAMDAVSTTCTNADSVLYIATLNPEVETVDINDLCTLKLWCDESACSLDSGELAYLLGALVIIRFKD